jgi:hypothetical protein
MPEYGAVQSGIQFSYCFDEDGELLYLDRPSPLRAFCPVLLSFFGGGDSLCLYGGTNLSDIFWTEVTIKPSLSIGDTSLVQLRMTAARDMPSGVDLRLSTAGLKLLSVPESIGQSVVAGDVITRKLLVVPEAMNGVHFMSLQFDACQESELDLAACEQTSVFRFLFEASGPLKYAGGRSFGVSTDAIAPKTFDLGQDHCNHEVFIGRAAEKPLWISR